MHIDLKIQTSKSHKGKGMDKILVMGMFALCGYLVYKDTRNRNTRLKKSFAAFLEEQKIKDLE